MRPHGHKHGARTHKHEAPPVADAPPLLMSPLLLLLLLSGCVAQPQCSAGERCRAYCAGFSTKDYMTTACPLEGGTGKPEFCGGRACENTSMQRSDVAGCYCCCSRRAYKGPDPCPMEASACQSTCRSSQTGGAGLVGVQCLNNSTLLASRTCAGRACTVIITGAGAPMCYCCCTGE